MLGDTLRTHREARGLTLQMLAEQIGVSETFIRQVESGMRAQVSWAVIQRAAVALSMPLHTLVDAAWRDAPPLGDLAQAGLNDDQRGHLQRLWRNIPRRLRPTTLRMAYAWARVETALDTMSQRPH